MHFKTIEEVETEPVSLAEARLQCKLTAEEGTDEDALLAVWITSARETAEQYTGRALAPRTLGGAVDAFPCSDEFELPLPPVTAVESIKYTDTAGTEQTLSPSAYSLSSYDCRRVSLTYGSSWPSTQCIADAVRVQFVAGYETAPKAVKAALLLMVAWFYEHRGDEMDPNDIQPPAAKALLDTVKLWGW